MNFGVNVSSFHSSCWSQAVGLAPWGSHDQRSAACSLTPTPLDPHPQPSGHKLGSHLSPRSPHSPARIPLRLSAPACAPPPGLGLLLHDPSHTGCSPGPQTWKQPECPPRVEQMGLCVCTRARTHTHTHTHTGTSVSHKREGSPPQTALGGGHWREAARGQTPSYRIQEPWDVVGRTLAADRPPAGTSRKGVESRR